MARRSGVAFALIAPAVVVLVGACASGTTEPGRSPAAIAFAVSAGAKDSRLTSRLEPLASREGWESDGSGWTSPGWRALAGRGVIGLGAHVPAHADEGFDVGPGHSPTRVVRFTPSHAERVEGALRDGHVVYSGAYGAGVDVVMTATRESVEELFVLEERTDHVAFAWDVSLPSGVAAVVELPDGSLAFQAASGETVLGVAAAYALDARGARREARLSWDGGARRLGLELDARGLVFPVLLDPAFETPVWKSASSGTLTARTGSAAAYDGAHGKVILFGGYVSARYDETWSWDGSAWSLLAPATKPSARGDHAMAYDAAHGKIVLFGGTSSAALNDTWLWDGTTWAPPLPAPTKSPAARADAAMAYDAAHGKTILFGGYGSSAFGDTWSWDGTDWSDVTPAPPALSPAARTGAAIAYDAAHGKIVLFGGTTGAFGSYLNDTWLWDGSAWTNPTPATSPTGRCYGRMVYDAASGKIVLFGGLGSSGNVTWTWDGTTWKSATPSTTPSNRYLQAMAYDAAHATAVLFGGWQLNSVGGNTIVADTWRYYTIGGACAVGTDCGTGYCVDGVCCQVDACGTCQSCAGTSPGTCTPVVNAPDPDTCGGASSCDAAGACKAANGQACADAATCASGHCADGVCCDSDCKGFCQACTAAGKGTGTDGACGNAAAGVDLHGDCPDDGAASCQRNGSCDGTGRCQIYAPGVACGVGVTCNDNEAAGPLCDGLGTCGSGKVKCVPYVCAPTGCLTSCSSDADCVDPFACDLASKKCAPKSSFSCDGDHTLVGPDGKTSDCTPFKCEGSVCKATCNSVVDCAYPNECAQETHTCVPPLGAPPPPESGCATTPAPRRSGGAAVLVAASIAVVLRRRRAASR